MPRIRSAKRTASPLLSEDIGKAPSRVTHAAEVADREERKKLLTGILRDGKATGAEAVAAARLLEAMERNGAAGQVAGIPPPTSRPEQVQRMVRLLTMGGKKIVAEALEIIATRSETSRTAKFQAAFDNNMPLDPNQIAEWKRRTGVEEAKSPGRGKGFGKHYQEDVSESDGGEDQRSRPVARRATPPEPERVRELHEAAAPVGAAQNENESIRERPDSAAVGELGIDPEVGGDE